MDDEPDLEVDKSYRVDIGLYRDDEKQNGNYYSILGLYRDNGKDNGNCYTIMGF